MQSTYFLSFFVLHEVLLAALVYILPLTIVGADIHTSNDTTLDEILSYKCINAVHIWRVEGAHL